VQAKFPLSPVIENI